MTVELVAPTEVIEYPGLVRVRTKRILRPIGAKQHHDGATRAHVRKMGHTTTGESAARRRRSEVGELGIMREGGSWVDADPHRYRQSCI
jgi:hypothetical protein